MATVQKILDERAKTHGDFSYHAAITQELKMALRSFASWEKLSPMKKEALEMIAHKIGRILAGDSNYRDHWVDIAGYATLIADRIASE